MGNHCEARAGLLWAKLLYAPLTIGLVRLHGWSNYSWLSVLAAWVKDTPACHSTSPAAGAASG